MSDSVDRVFVHALATVRRLPRTGSSRPPPASRLRLYGLYKQSMEGDVSAILARPILPPPTPDPNTHTSPNAVHRYASKDLRAREAQAEIEKWDAWHACAGMSKTEAKREYISTLIETMKEYASGTSESRELVGELEFVWNQIKSQSGSDPDDNSGEKGERESPGRMMERAGLGRMGSGFSGVASGSGARTGSAQGSGSGSGRRKETRQAPSRNQSGLRVLSPVSQRSDGGSSVIEGVEADRDDDEDEDDNQQHHTAPTSPIVHRAALPPSTPPIDPMLTAWQSVIETHLRSLTTEIAALREQLSANHLLSSSTYSHTYYTLTRRQRIWHHIKWWARWLIRGTIKQGLWQLGALVLVILWGRWQGERGIEMRVRKVLVKGWDRVRWMWDWLLLILKRRSLRVVERTS